MAEFALVLPILALLTFGTLEVALYLQQQSSINAAAFMAARAASVLGNDETTTRASLKDYVDATGMAWLSKATVSNDASGKTSNVVAYSLTAGSDRVSGMISGLTQGKVSGFDTLSAGAALPLEYDSRRVKSIKHAADPKYRPRTRSMIQYQSKEDPKKDLLTGSWLKAKNLFDQLVAIRTALATPPSPKPSTKPSGAPSGNGGGAVVVPVASPPPPSVEIPVLPLDKNAEPFSGAKPIVANPKHRNDAGDDGREEAFAQDYMGPLYEESEELKQDVAYKMKNIAMGLTSYEGTLGTPNQPKTVENAARRIGEMAKTTKNPLALAAIKQVTGFVGDMNKSLDKPYKDYRKNEEKVLFKKVRQ